MKRLVLIILTVATFSACNDGPSEGLIQLHIENARGPQGIQALKVQSPDVDEMIHVTQFKVTISGEGMSPIVATADASAAQIPVMGIPVGSGRSILIEALNKDGTVIRRREVDGIAINPGVVTPIETSLNTVPLITNLKSGAVVLSKNFKIVGFGEPASSIDVEDTTASQSVSLNESAGSSVVISPSISDGLFDFTPASVPLGKQTIKLIDKATGESSSLTVTVVQGTERPGRRIVAAGDHGAGLTIGTGFGGSKGANLPLAFRTLGKSKP